MKKEMEYKGYFGSVEYSKEDKVFFGQLLGIHSLVLYEGDNEKELADDFRGAVDDYLEVCRANNSAPEIPYLETEALA